MIQKMLMLYRKTSSCTRITVLAKLLQANLPEDKAFAKHNNSYRHRITNCLTEYFSADTNVISMVEQGKIRFAFKEKHDVRH